MDLGEGVHFHPLFLVVAPALILLPSLAVPGPPATAFSEKKNATTKRKPRPARAEDRYSLRGVHVQLFFFAGRRQ